MTSTEKQLKDKDGNDITDTNAVHKTGVETIAGNKTFTGIIVSQRATDDNSVFNKIIADYDPTVTPTTQRNAKIFVATPSSNTSTILAELDLKLLTNGKRQLGVKILNSDNSTWKTVILAESD